MKPWKRRVGAWIARARLEPGGLEHLPDLLPCAVRLGDAGEATKLAARVVDEPSLDARTALAERAVVRGELAEAEALLLEQRRREWRPAELVSAASFYEGRGEPDVARRLLEAGARRPIRVAAAARRAPGGAVATDTTTRRGRAARSVRTSRAAAPPRARRRSGRSPGSPPRCPHRRPSSLRTDWNSEMSAPAEKSCRESDYDYNQLLPCLVAGSARRDVTRRGYVPGQQCSFSSRSP